MHEEEDDTARDVLYGIAEMAVVLVAIAVVGIALIIIDAYTHFIG